MGAWQQVDIRTLEGTVKGLAPVIISASRSTDIPAFYSEWLMYRLDAGYIKWINPFNRSTPQHISFKKARVFVFWSKNPQPMLEYLSEFDRRGIGYYFSFTLNDYEAEGLEPKIPPLEERIRTFRELSQRIGRSKVIWRFDPLIMANSIAPGLSFRLDVEALLAKIDRVGQQVHDWTDKLVISFADVGVYAKVRHNLSAAKISYTEFDQHTATEFASGLSALKKRRGWDLEIATCAEQFNGLSLYGIKRNSCIDGELMARLFPHDAALMKFLGLPTPKMEMGQLPGFDAPASRQLALLDSAGINSRLKDRGQRDACGCIMSKDIGQYSTCPHLCRYCYANTSAPTALRNYKKHMPECESIIPDAPMSKPDDATSPNP